MWTPRVYVTLKKLSSNFSKETNIPAHSTISIKHPLIRLSPHTSSSCSPDTHSSGNSFEKNRLTDTGIVRSQYCRIISFGLLATIAFCCLIVITSTTLLGPPELSLGLKELLSNTNIIVHDIQILNVTRTLQTTTLPNTIDRFSKFRCTGDENNIDAWPDRLCVFENICYNIAAQQFEYYRRSHNPKFPIFFDGVRGMLSDFRAGQSRGGFVSLTSRGDQPWAPIIVDHACPSTNVTWLTNLHTLWREFFGDTNFGHIVWEDMGSIFYSLERMNEFDNQLVVMHVNPVPRDSMYQKFEHNVLAVLTSKPLIEHRSYLTSFNISYVCFNRFLAGGNLHLFHSSSIKESNGREALFYKWRSKIIKYHKLDPEHVPSRHHIVLTNKSTSVWAKAPSGIHRAIANLKEVELFVKKTYPNISVDVIEWHKVSFPQQIEILLNTTILISPAGGVAMITPFLPRGSHAIIMDYYVSDTSFDFKLGSSASMEGMLLNHFPHFKKDYYQIYDPQDYKFDVPGTRDTRNEASIVINFTRLHLLMESAIEDMNL